VDDERQLRISFQRYAAGLSSYARRARTEKMAAIEDLRRRREQVEVWLAAATESTFIDQETGLLNRAAAEVRIETQIGKKQPFCVIVADGAEKCSLHPSAAAGQIMKDLGDRLAATIRPYDMIFRWSQDQLVTVFEASGADIAARIQQISGWLGDNTGAVEIDGKPSIVKTHTAISVVEHNAGEAFGDLIARIESESRQEAAAR
jgi:GGDEF domain-containing protein